MIEKEISPFDTKEIEKDGVVETVSVWIPECCREGWDSCKHVPQKAKKTKRNIAL